MATGRNMQLTRQVGEHLVAAEFGRLGYVATPFAGNVPMFDLLAADVRGYAIPVQVKTITPSSKAWQFSADTFLDIEITDNKQTIKGNVTLLKPQLLSILVKLNDDRRDEFYTLHLRDLQDHIANHYRNYLNLKGGLRPKKPQSLHCAISPKELEALRENWKLLHSSFPPTPISP
jgi:hypothetical protein